jgi:hypothetical protein
VKEAKAEIQRLHQDLLDTCDMLCLMNDTLWTTYKSKMLEIHEEFNRLVALIKEKDDDVAQDFMEADCWLNHHQREINNLHTKVGMTVSSYLMMTNSCL